MFVNISCLDIETTLEEEKNPIKYRLLLCTILFKLTNAKKSYFIYMIIFC